MAGGTAPPHGATRFIETTRGVLSYSQLAPILAERVLVIERAIASGEFEGVAITPQFICDMHRRLCGDLVPDWAGLWRSSEVRVGDHTPPPAHSVRALMVDYVADLQARLIEGVAETQPGLLTEHLAFAEGRLLSIHPFMDFNGRVTRLLLRELLCRFELPDVDLTPTGPEAIARCIGALREADALNWSPLRGIWELRFGGDVERRGPSG